MATKADLSPPPPRLLPHDIAAEESVLGAAMVDDTALGRMAGLVQPNDFYREKNGLVFEALQTLAERGEPTNLVMVGSELATRGRLDDVGGLAYLTQLTNELPTSVGCEFYARIVARDATYRRLASAAGRIAQIAFQGGANLDEALATAQALVTLVQRQSVNHGWRPLPQIVADRRADLEAWADNPRGVSRGLSTGLAALDDLLLGRGLLPGKTYVVGAATSIGKSTFLRVLLRNVALAGHHVGLLTLEQDETEVVEEIAFGLARIDRHHHELLNAPLDEYELQDFQNALTTLQDLHTFHVDDSPALTPAEVAQRMARLASQHDVRVFGVDYLHLLELGNGRRNSTGEQELSDGLRFLRDTAKRLNVTLVMLSQMNYELTGKDRKENEYRPTKRDFRGSGAVTHLPFCVLALHRRDYFVQEGLLRPKFYRLRNGDTLPGDRMPERGIEGAQPILDHELEVVVVKQQRGPRGVATLFWDGAHSDVRDSDQAQPAAKGAA